MQAMESRCLFVMASLSPPHLNGSAAATVRTMSPWPQLEADVHVPGLAILRATHL